MQHKTRHGPRTVSQVFSGGSTCNSLASLGAAGSPHFPSAFKPRGHMVEMEPRNNLSDPPAAQGSKLGRKEGHMCLD